MFQNKKCVLIMFQDVTKLHEYNKLQKENLAMVEANMHIYN